MTHNVMLIHEDYLESRIESCPEDLNNEPY